MDDWSREQMGRWADIGVRLTATLVVACGVATAIVIWWLVLCGEILERDIIERIYDECEVQEKMWKHRLWIPQGVPQDSANLLYLNEKVPCEFRRLTRSDAVKVNLRSRA